MLATARNNQNKGATVLNNPQQQEIILDSIAGNSAMLQKVNDKAKAKGTLVNMN